MREFENWSTARLIDFEERLYDDECDGADNWFLRDKVIIELNYRDWKEITKMNNIIKFLLGFANIPEQAINDLERSWPGIRRIADAAKELEPYLKQASPHIDALEPLGIKMFPIVQRVWPDILELLPVAHEWINIVSKK